MGLGHVLPTHRPPAVRVVDGWVGVALVLDAAEQCQALVCGHSGQVEPQLIQKVTGPEGIGVSEVGATDTLCLQCPGKEDTEVTQ